MSPAKGPEAPIPETPIAPEAPGPEAPIPEAPVTLLLLTFTQMLVPSLPHCWRVRLVWTALM